MSIIYNGTEVKKVIYNGTELQTVTYNGTKVFSGVDPTKDSFTEEEFIAVVNAGLQSQMTVGATVTIANSVTSSYSTWYVAGVNHDNTTGTVDLVQANTVYSQAFSSDNNTYSSSSIRTWLNGTYYNGFSSTIRGLMKTMNVQTATSLTAYTTTSDKVKLLSAVELNLSSYHSYMPGYNASYRNIEGYPYPIFTSGTYDESNVSRVRTGAYTDWWLRSRYTYNTRSVWSVGSNGSLGLNEYNSTHGTVPVLRF